MIPEHQPVSMPRSKKYPTALFIYELIFFSFQSEYIVSNVDDLLSLFDADFGMLVIGEGAKILGSDEHGQEILIIAEYLRLKQFAFVLEMLFFSLADHGDVSTIQASQAVTIDFPDLQLTTGEFRFYYQNQTIEEIRRS